MILITVLVFPSKNLLKKIHIAQENNTSSMDDSLESFQRGFQTENYTFLRLKWV